MLIYLIHTGFKTYDVSYVGENIGLAYISSNLQSHGYSTRIMDCIVDGWNENTLIQEIITHKPSIVLLSFYEENSKETLAFINMLRVANYKSPILLGGIYVTLNTKTVLNSLVDPTNVWCVRGEGEEVSVEFAKEIERGNKRPSIKGVAYKDKKEIVNDDFINMVCDINSLPFPDRSVMDRIYGRLNASIYLLSSRGCYGNCSFCILNIYNSKVAEHYRQKKWRERTISCVVDEMKELLVRYPGALIKFVDSNFIGWNPQRGLLLADEIKKRNLKVKFAIECRANDVNEDILVALKEVGLVSIFIGVESGSNRVLQRYNKEITVEQNQFAIDTIRKLHIGLKMGFILFDEFSTISELRENTEFLHKNNSCVFHPYRPLIIEKYSQNNEKYDVPVIYDERTRLAHNIIKELCARLLPYRAQLDRLRKNATQKECWQKEMVYSILGKFILFDKHGMNLLLSMCEDLSINSETVRNEIKMFSDHFLKEIGLDFENIDKMEGKEI
jgi:radical SAM superfamily enzyme YgiQ (UPF0313 family)